MMIRDCRVRSCVTIFLFLPSIRFGFMLADFLHRWLTNSLNIAKRICKLDLSASEAQGPLAQGKFRFLLGGKP